MRCVALRSLSLDSIMFSVLSQKRITYSNYLDIQLIQSLQIIVLTCDISSAWVGYDILEFSNLGVCHYSFTYIVFLCVVKLNYRIKAKQKKIFLPFFLHSIYHPFHRELLVCVSV